MKLLAAILFIIGLLLASAECDTLTEQIYSGAAGVFLVIVAAFIIRREE